MNPIDQAFIRAYETDEVATRSREGETPVEPSAGTRFAARQEPRPPEPRPSGLDRSGKLGERRPLSAFAVKGPTVEAHFKPALEVDAFRWSTVSEHLISRCRDRLRPALLSLMAADEAGRSLIGIGAPAPDVGCTTVLACLARLLAEAGKTVAIVDGNFAAPALARQLGLAVEAGWEEVLSGRLPLAEGVVYSLTDRIALLPLVAGGARAAATLDSIHASVTAGVLRYHYDIVLFDLGAIGHSLQGEIARRLAQQCRLDGVVLTTGQGHASAVHPQRLMQSAPELASICLGVVENQLRAA